MVQDVSIDRGDAGSLGWRGTSRYEVLKQLGSGGMGIVYEAFDRERGHVVALKALLNIDPTAFYRFKQEFRSIVGLLHTNVVQLYELVVPDEGKPFFTMELVRGVDFLRHVRARPSSSQALAEPSVTVRQSGAIHPAADSRQGTADRGDSGSRKRFVADEVRLRDALHQLARGLSAVHAAGQIHRDVKPPNVLVTPEGRVVLLDFGVATELTRGRRGLPGDGDNEMVGTATYMAPEQALGEPPSPASDWYSVGVILYEALVGLPPFVGAATDVLALKITMDPRPPSECVEGVPPDLDTLCMALLQQTPEARPTGFEVLRRLGGGPTSAPPALTGRSAISGLLIGRETQIASLREAFEATVAGETVVARLGGAAGMGKSSIASHFVDDLAARRGAVVLRARAYEREALPYKAVDGAIDGLTRHLLALMEGDPSFELPESVGTAARLFPVFQRIQRISQAMEPESGDPQAVRRRGFHAVRQLLVAVARRQPLVLFLDDVHWGDADSASMLIEVLRGPDAPPLLVLMTSRDDEAKASPFLRELGERWPSGVRAIDVAVGPLGREDAERLAAYLLDDAGQSRMHIAAAVARESRGSPFLIEEFVRSNRLVNSSGETSLVLTLEQLVGDRLDRLPAGARRLVELLAVAGRPLSPAVLAAAAGVTGGLDEAIALLGARRFARTGQRDGRDIIEATHDRIRETIVALLPETTLSEGHRALACALEQTPDSDLEAIALHWLGAGDEARGVQYAEQAAERSSEKLAFDHAVRLLRLALEHVPPTSDRAQALRVRLAVALRDGGRCSEAAQAYIGAAAAAAPDRRIEFQRAAAEQLLTAGRIEEGEEMLRGVLRAVGIRAPRSQASAVFWLLVYRVWLAFLGLRIRERESSELRPGDHIRVEVLSAASSCFAIVDLVLGRCMTTRYLIEALRCGDRLQLTRAIAMEGGQSSAAGGPETARERALYATARRLAAREGTRHATAMVDGVQGVGLCQRARWHEAHGYLERAMSVPSYGNSIYAMARLFAAYVTTYMGDLNEYRRRIARLLAEAEDRGDLYTWVNLTTTATMRLGLAAGDPEGARRRVREVLALWPTRSLLVQHWQGLVFGMDADLYSGNAAAAHEQLRLAMPKLKKSFLMRAVFVRVFTWWTSGRLAIASIRSDPGSRTARIAEARRMAGRLEREYDRGPKSMAAQIRGCAAAAEGDRAGAITELRRALALLDGPNDIWAWSINHRLGLLLGGAEGRELVQNAVRVMKAQGVHDPDRWAYVYLPGEDWVQPLATLTSPQRVES